MDRLMSIFDTSGIKHIFSSPYYPRGNSRIENIHNFLKKTMVNSFMEVNWNGMMPCL